MHRSNSRPSSESPERGNRLGLSGLATALALVLAAGLALAEPRGGEVLNGTATITRDGRHTQIETGTPRTRIRWEGGFDIDVDESVHAQQPHARSLLVNEVPDAGVTRIDGRLSSNGRIWILNPAGVYFGGSAIVEVAGLVAAAGEITDEAFVSRLQHFRNLNGEVRNYGRIDSNGGKVSLIGRSVANHGQIVTRGGDFLMAAGDEVTVFRHDTYIEVHVPDLDLRPNVENTGSIDTGGGRARLAAGDFLGLAIRNTGAIRAREISIEAGRNSIVELSGSLDASDDTPGGSGGHIEVTGEWLIVDDAELDASGSDGGGEIWVGGGPGGGGSLPTARGTFLSGDSEILADALEHGDGGTIVVWADEIGSTEGLLSAQGGPIGGRGGFIETSSKGRMDVAADIRVGARYGLPGTWLLDPVNVAIVNQAEFDATPGAKELVELGDLSALLFQPESSQPSPGMLLDTTLVETLALGGQVLVVTESLDPDDPGDDLGWIEVRTPIEIPASASVRPGTKSILELRASDDVRVMHRIASDNPELQLDLVLQANEVTQQEPTEQQRDGDVIIEAPIKTQGGFVVATGTNIVVEADIDTTNDAAPEDSGGSISLLASDPTPDEESSEYGNVEIGENVTITTRGGLFFSSGELFQLGDGARIETYKPATDPEAGDIDTGNLSILHRDQVTLDGDIISQNIVVVAGSEGQGDLRIGSPGTNTTLSGSTLQLSAGDGGANSAEDPGPQVLIDRSVNLRGADGTGRPNSLAITQDAAIGDAHAPLASQYDGDLAGMLLALTSVGGSPDTTPDILFSQDLDRFTGTNLVLAAPDSVQFDGVIDPHNVEIEIDGDFEVTDSLAQNLRPVGPGPNDGLLRIRAGRAGSGNLTFETFDASTALVADRIALQAVSGGSESAVDPTGARFTPGSEFEIRQDADILDTSDPENSQNASIPLLSQFTDGIAGLEYKLLSQGGSITISDGSRVQGTQLSLIALDGIGLDVADPIQVERADIGGFNGFEVTQDVLDKLDIAPDGGGKRILTLRSGTGALTFQTSETIQTEGQPDETVDIQVEVEADRIHLAGANIDVASGRPLFQSDATTSPERLIFEQDALITEIDLPTEDNFPDGLGPSELFVVQSNLGGISLTQQAPMLLPRAPDFRGWDFPVQDDTQVILVAPTVEVRRRDGFDLVLGEYDDIWGTQVFLTADFDPLNLGSEGKPIVDGVVDARELNSLRGFEGDIDFLTPDLVSEIQKPADEDGADIASFSLTVDQDGDFALRGNSYLPDLSGDEPLEFQPDFYILRSRLGSIEVDNSLLADTNLVLQTDSQEDAYIDFDLSSDLVVNSLAAVMGGNFEFGSSESGPDGARVDAQESIQISSGLVSGGSLSFTSNVQLAAKSLTLNGGLNSGVNPDSEVDARTNSPVFDVEEFTLRQTGNLYSGLSSSTGEILSTLPAPAQFDTGGTPLDLYRVETIFGDLELNDPAEVLIARSVELAAGSLDSAASLVLRADTGSSGACQSACGTATDPNLVLIPDGSPVEAISLEARQILLEAPDGYVDAGDERARFDLQAFGGLFAIRQQDAVNDASRIPDAIQFVQGLQTATITLQGLDGITADALVAEKLEGTNLVLAAGLSQANFDAAETGIRLQDPVPDADPELPPHVYDRLADSNGDGVVDGNDEAVDGQAVVIDDSVPFDLLLRSLDIQTGENGTIDLGNVHIMTDADQTYRSAIRLLGETELSARAGLLIPLPATLTPTASTIIFEKPIDGTTAGGESLTVNATERIHFKDEIGTSNPLGSLTLNLEQLIQFDLEPPTPRVEFGTEDFTGTFRVLANNIFLNPQSGDPSSPYVRSRVPDAATFFRRGGSLEFTTQNFNMGVNEKLSVDGSELRILAAGGSATIGDLSALDRIQVIADDIRIQRRKGGDVVRANGRSLRDDGVDFVANDIDFQFDFDSASDPTGSITLYQNQIGQGSNARFGIADPTEAPAFMDEFSVLSLEFNLLNGPGLGALGTNLTLDGVPDGISRVALARSYAPLGPTVSIATPAAERISDPSGLSTIGLALREASALELQSAARGAAVYQDLASLPTTPGGTLVVSETRLVAGEVEETVAVYERVFGSNGSRVARVQRALQAAVDDYKRSTGARRVVGFELRRYVYNRPSSQFEAYQELQSLDALFRHHRRSGLTPSEYGPIQLEWLQAVQPDGITLDELSEFVHPSRYVRGSDVLDVFGD